MLRQNAVQDKMQSATKFSLRIFFQWLGKKFLDLILHWTEFCLRLNLSWTEFVLE